MKTLEELDLSSNELEGNLPRCWANLASLTSILLSSNQFTGDIGLSPLVNLTSLEDLRLSNNNFQIPISFRPFFNHSRLKAIECLNNDYLLETDEFQASVPSFQLYYIGLSDADRHGNNNAAVPKFLYHQHSLRSICLNDISFSGKSFLWLIENNTELLTLVLRNNSFTGPLQMPSNPISKLSVLDFSSNHFSGNIPEDIATYFPGLRVLRLSANSFTGTIPSSLGDMATIFYLDLSHNLLSGNIPDSLAMGCRSLFTLRLSNNTLQGSILPMRHNLTKLFSLELDVNNFTTIPNSLSSCYNLVVLKINHNHLEGPFPTAICQLKSLEYLDISENSIAGILPACFSPPDITLSGSIPTCLGNIMFMPLLDKLGIPRRLLGIRGGIIFDMPNTYEEIYLEELIQFVTKSIPLVYRGEMLNYFSAIDLSCNNFLGHIPPEIWKLFYLKSLNLSRNSLSGTIPITFANLTDTESLDLSYNRLTGNIPSQLANLDSLQVFNVSFNNLSGPIPEGPHFQTFNGMSYVGNQLLCGRAVSRNCANLSSGIVPPGTMKGTNFMDMDMDTFYVSFATAYIIMFLAFFAILCINPYWRQVWFHLIE
ncbi:hypothetical protein RJ640_015375, partial [Escallonia rubra]